MPQLATQPSRKKTNLIGLSTQVHKSVFSPSPENLVDETASNEVEYLDIRKTDLLDHKLSEVTKHDIYKAIGNYRCLWNTAHIDNKN